MPTLVLVLGVLLLAVVAIMLGCRLVASTRPITTTSWCPLRHEYLAVDYRAAVWNNALLDVERCSAFVPPRQVTCEKSCMQWRQRGTVAP